MRYVMNPFSPIPAHKDSHVRGWSKYWAETVSATLVTSKTHGDLKLHARDVVYIDHGVNFSGGLNLFGGVTDDVVDRVHDLVYSGATLASLDMKMPDYHLMLESRIGQKSATKRLTRNLVRDLAYRLEKSKVVSWDTLLNASKRMTVGDSHSTAFAPYNSVINRTNGQTLFGWLSKDHKLPLDRMKHLSTLTLCFGSVDIRHHLGKQGNMHLDALLESYRMRINNIQKQLPRTQIEICAPVPVEYEGRKIPKTGWHDGRPFTGSLVERKDLTLKFISKMERDFDVVTAPKSWYDMDPELYAKRFMELSSSVHISPMHYRSAGGWNV